MLVAKLTAVLNDESGRHAAEALRIERQHALQALQQVDDDDPDEIEEQHRERVALPVVLRLRVDARDAVDEPLDGPQHRREEGALAFVDGRHERAERLDEQRRARRRRARSAGVPCAVIRTSPATAARRPDRRRAPPRVSTRGCRGRSWPALHTVRHAIEEPGHSDQKGRRQNDDHFHRHAVLPARSERPRDPDDHLVVSDVLAEHGVARVLGIGRRERQRRRPTGSQAVGQRGPVVFIAVEGVVGRACVRGRGARALERLATGVPRDRELVAQWHGDRQVEIVAPLAVLDAEKIAEGIRILERRPLPADRSIHLVRVRLDRAYG